MKKITLLTFALATLLITSCAKSISFPVSDLVPAAEIQVTKKQDANKNYAITVTANNLASATRLQPSKQIYVVWGITEDNGVRNLGQLSNKNAKKVELKTSTPFNVKEIFITAENEGNITEPSRTEITRTRL